MTIDLLALCMAFVVGLGLGLLHFGGLWLTVRRLPTARQPHLVIGSSILGRLSLSVLGLYGVVTRGGWEHLLVCLGGFLVVRSLLIRWWRAEPPQLAAKGVVLHGYHPD